MGAMSDIRDIALFAGLTDGEARAFGVHCTWRTAGEGELIIDYEDDSSDVLFVLSGKVRILLRTPAGREVILGEMGEGNFFGEMAAIDGSPRSANVTALEPTRVCVMPGKVFCQLCTNVPATGLAVMRRLCERIRLLNIRIGEYAFFTTRQRLCAELLRLSRPRAATSGQRIVSPPPLQRELADRISTQREVVTRELAALARRGLIEKTRGGLVIADPEALNAVIAEGLSK